MSSGEATGTRRIERGDIVGGEMYGLRQTVDA